MVDAKEYRKKNKKPVTTRSGETFTINKISPFRLIEIFIEAGFSTEDMGKKDMSREEAMELAKILLPECIVELAPIGEGDDTHLALDEIKDLSEFEDLINSVLEAVGVSEEAVEKAADFRSPPDVADGGVDSEDLPRVGDPDRDPPASD